MEKSCTNQTYQLMKCNTTSLCDKLKSWVTQMEIERRTQCHFSNIFAQNTQPESSHEIAPEEPKLRIIPQNDAEMSVIFKSVNVIKLNESMRNLLRLRWTKEI